MAHGRLRDDGVFELSGQFRRRQITHSGTKRTLDGWQQITDRRAVQRRNRDPLGEVQKRQATFEIVAHLLALLGRETVPLIGDDDQRPASFEDQTEQADVLFGNAFLRIENGHNDMCFLDRLQRLRELPLGALARRRFGALGKILLGSAAAALGVWLQQQLPESIGFAIQAVLMLVSAVLILLGIVAMFIAQEP